MAKSTFSSVVNLPRESRKVAIAVGPSRPMAVSTCEGLSVTLLQAAPELTANFLLILINKGLPKMPRNETLHTCGNRLEEPFN